MMRLATFSAVLAVVALVGAATWAVFCAFMARRRTVQPLIAFGTIPLRQMTGDGEEILIDPAAARAAFEKYQASSRLTEGHRVDAVGRITGLDFDYLDGLEPAVGVHLRVDAPATIARCREGRWRLAPAFRIRAEERREIDGEESRVATAIELIHVSLIMLPPRMPAGPAA